MMDVEVSLRTNIDYLFTMREVILANRQRLYKNFFGQFGSFAEFEKVMVACTQDYRSLVMDNTNAGRGADGHGTLVPRAYSNPRVPAL